MATVYKAKCHVLNRYVAIKILKDEFTTDSDFIRRFNTEAQAAASLTHPNIVSIYDVGNEDNLYYIVMELIQGKTLKEIITEDGRLSWKWSVNIAIQIASALEVAHKNNIIHRDIKPHNIIITEDGIAKVTDFGIAKAVSNSTITAFGTTIGSVHYFSPEHARGGYTDAKSDLYSLGVVMYEMVTGRVPFDADTPVSVALKQVQEEPVDPITYAKDLPVSVNRIILKAMQKDPNLRYQNATEMLKDLSMALKRPNEDFVVLALRDDDSPTQKIPTIYELDMEKNNDRNAPKIGEGEEKKKGKLAKIKEFYEKHKFLKFLTILAILAIIFVIVGLITVGIINGSREEQAYLPDEIANMDSENPLTGEEAQELLEAAGFTNVQIQNEANDTIEIGYVISIEPNTANYLYNLNQEIIITVSAGPEIGTLPAQMVGKQQSEVEAELKDLGFTNINVTEETSETVEEGIVLSVDPAEGEEVAKNSTINLVVSSGSQFETVTVRSVVGETEANARTILSAISENLAVEVTYEEDYSADDGVVISQTVDGKALNSGETVDVKENVSVTLVVNKLPVESTITFNINVASYYPEADEPTNTTTDDEEGNTTNSSSSSSGSSTVSVVVYVGGIQVSTQNVSTDTTDYSYSYATSGTKNVLITVGGNQVYNETLNFSGGDQTITISK